MRLKALLTIILSLCAVSTYAQFKASIQGTVQDSKGGVVAGPKSGSQMRAQAPYAKPPPVIKAFIGSMNCTWTYTVTVEASGFKQTISKNIVVDAEQPRGYDVILTSAQYQTCHGFRFRRRFANGERQHDEHY